MKSKLTSFCKLAERKAQQLPWKSGIAVPFSMAALYASIALSPASPPTTVQFEQSPYAPLSIPIWGSHTDGNWILQTFDDFVFPHDTFLTEFHWQAVNYDELFNASNPMVPDYEKIVVTIWSDEDGQPGDEVHATTRPIDHIETIELPTYTIDQNGAEFPRTAYQIELSEPFLAKAGQRYWISPLAHSDRSNPVMAWWPGEGEADPNRELSMLGIEQTGSSWQRESENGSEQWSQSVQANRHMILKGRPANDQDADGMDDAWEATHHLNPQEDDSASDPDNDGATNLQEYERKSDPYVQDSDGDGLLDGVETNHHRYVDANDTGTDPLRADTDGDGLSDHFETTGNAKTDPNLADTDGDRYHDQLEINNGYDPADASEFPKPIVLEALLGNSLIDAEIETLEVIDKLDINAVRKVFDGEIGTAASDWVSNIPASPVWIQVTLEAPITLTHFTMASARNRPQDDPDLWEIQGSNDGGETFTTIMNWEGYREEDALWTERAQVLRFNAGIHYTTPPAYTTFRLYSRGAAVTKAFHLGEFELFGTEYKLGFTDIQRDADQQMQIQWHSLPNKLYTIESSPDLVSWLAIADGYPSAGRLTSFTEAATPVDGRATYYRVREFLPLEADFESGDAGWRALRNSGETAWELGRSDVEKESAGDHVWATALADNHGPNADIRLQSPVVDLATYPGLATLTFQYYIDSAGDEGGQLRFLNEEGELLFTHDEPFTGRSTHWKPFSLVLPTALQDERFIVEFRFLSDEDEEVGAGWYIDDVFVR